LTVGLFLRKQEAELSQRNRSTLLILKQFSYKYKARHPHYKSLYIVYLHFRLSFHLVTYFDLNDLKRS